LRNSDDSAVICPRTESDRKIGNAGWLHILDAKNNGDYKPNEWEQKFTAYQSNVYPAMVKHLSQQLGVKVESIEKLDIGFNPSQQAWMFAEQDDKGNITGLLLRHLDGHKTMEKGSKRGLVYDISGNNSVLVVEGASDVLAAIDIGYSAVGRPSAEDFTEWLVPLLQDKEIIVIGENDEPGRKGMEAVSRIFGRKVQKCLPPPHFKDLRAWHPTREEFDQWVKEHAEWSVDRIVDSTTTTSELVDKWLKDKYDNKLLHYANGNWYKFIGSHYKEIDELVIRNEFYEYFKDYIVNFGKTTKPLDAQKHLVDRWIDYLKSKVYLESPKELFYIKFNKQLDPKNIVVFQNGLLHIDTGELESLTPDIFVTSTLPYAYDPKAQCPNWEWFSRDIFNNEQQSVELLREWWGYNLIASNYMEHLMIFYGVPRSGKSTALGVLQNLLGNNRCFAANMDSFSLQFGLEAFVDKYALTLSEDQADKKEATKILQTWKRITGQDKLTVHRKYKGDLQASLFCRLTYATNEVPVFHDIPGALIRRLNLLCFRNNYAALGKMDVTLKDRLVKETPGIAIWALEGLRRLLKTNVFTKPSSCTEDLAEFEALMNPLWAMVNEHCELNPTHWETCDAIFDLHKAVYKEDNMWPMGRELFGRRFKTSFPCVRKARRRVAGELDYVYEGVSILPHSKQRYLK
jgi:putative DNA primase/helicase